MALQTQRPNIVGVRIDNGLGNQMFQYAAGLALSQRLGASLFCDTRHYERRDRGDRLLGLQSFGIELNTARVPPFKVGRRIAAGLRLLPDPFRGATQYISTDLFDPSFRELTRGPVALSGFFQSWRYHEGQHAAIRSAFDTSRLSTPRTAGLAAEIAAARNPVAVHVRRGDYARSPQAIAFYGLLPADYYFSAKAALDAGIDEPTYFLFTDDLVPAQSLLADWEGLRPVTGHSAYEDMYLMSLCKHFIIANSTFGWWGAWLGIAPDKQVFAPQNWVGTQYPHPFSIDDRLPPDWIRI